MGISGLTTFIDENFRRWERRNIKGKVVLDGNSLCYSLHDYHRIDWTHGGQYGEFREVVIHFATQLRNSGISPIVVFDGIDFKGEKGAVFLRRRRDTVRTIRGYFIEGQPCAHNILPTLLKDVFRQTLEECHIPLYVVDGEADREIAALANHYGCPVVTFDSDYCVFNVVGGYIPFSRLAWESTPVTAEVYLVENFAAQFKLAEKLHFFIPVLLGNDFLEPVTHPQFSDYVRRRIHKFPTRQRIRAREVIEFLSSFRSVEDLLDQVLVLRAGEAIKRELQSKFDASQKMYSPEAITEESLMHSTLLRFGDGSKLPKWVLGQYRKGYFASSLMETAVVGRNFLRVVPDNPRQETSLAVSRPIRVATYGILSPHLRNTFVTEIVRYQDDLREEMVEACFFVGDEQLPSVDIIPSLKPKQRLHVFCLVIGVHVETLMNFDKNWWLVIATSCYWARVASPSKHLIKALVLCLVESSSGHSRRKHYPAVDGSLTTLHQYSKWQCIYVDAMKLNNLLLNPVIFVSPALLFDGKLITFYAHVPPRDINVFVKKVPNPRLYSELQAVIEAALPPRCPTKGAYRPPRQRREHPDKCVSVQQKHPPAFAVGNRFALLSLADESSSDEVSDE